MSRYAENTGNNFAGSGAHAWHLDNQTESVLYLSNLGNQECPIGMRVQANGVAYFVTDVRLKAHETRAINLRQLRDAQKTDFQGHKIPADAADGSVLWARLKNLPVTGTLDVVSDDQLVTPEVSSGCCCPANYQGLSVTPQSPSLLPGQPQQFLATLATMDCNGTYYYTNWTSNSSWTSSSPTVATVNSSGYAVAETGGTTNIIATGNSCWEQYMCCAGCCNPCACVPVEGGSTVNVLTATVNSVNLTSDQVQVTVAGGSSTNQGTLVVTWNGPNGNAAIVNAPESPGTYTFNPNVNNLVTGQYTGVTAKLTLNGVTATGTLSYPFNVLGSYLHTQYNTPAELLCSGSPAPAYLTTGPPSCPWSTVSLISGFIPQAWLNGSGITISYGSIQESLLTCSAPPGGNQNYFRQVSQVAPGCVSPNNYLSNLTVAADVSQSSPLRCGDWVLIVGQGGGGGTIGTVKVVTDSCPACLGQAHMDDYNTSNACSLTGNANYLTIRGGR